MATFSIGGSMTKTSETTDACDPESTEAFEKRILSAISPGFLIPCIAIGSKLGLFDKMAEFKEPVTSQQIADAMTFKERYVREWLNSMVCLGVFDYDKSEETYHFPENRHALFTIKGGMRNIAILTQGHTLVTRVYRELQTCFQKDGPPGIPYEHYEGFHEWREIRVNTQFSETYIKQIFEQVPGLVEKLESGVSVCDIGCGTGVQAILLAKMFPRSTFHSYDISAEAIRIANESMRQHHLHNISFDVQDVCRQLPLESFDLITGYNVIHDLPFASEALDHVYRALKPRGLFYMMDIYSNKDQRQNLEFLYTMSLFHCMAQSLYHEGSEGLGMLWGVDKAREMLRRAGFTGIRNLHSPEPMLMHIVADKQ